MAEPITKRYNLILTDPPWRYASTHGQGAIGSTANSSYPTMTKDELIAMDIKNKYAEKDCVLLLWATAPQLDTAIDVIRGWGFTYKTQFVTWIKVSRAGNVLLGTGHYTRSNPEFLLLATCGRVGPFRQKTRTTTSSVVFAERREHSRKPDAARDVIDRVFGTELSRLEMFAREKTPGWDVWGNETTKFNGVTKARRPKKIKNRHITFFKPTWFSN